MTRNGGRFEALEVLDWKYDIGSWWSRSLFVYVPYLDNNKKGKRCLSGVAWIKGKTKEDILVSFMVRSLISISLLRLGKFIQEWFCHYQLGEDCWELYV